MFRRRFRLQPCLLSLVVCAALAPAARAADFFWSTGDFVTGATAPEPLLSGDTLFITSGGTKRFVGSSFTNQGLVRWQADVLQGGNGTVVTNSGVWQSESDANTLSWAFGGRPTFVNTGSPSFSTGPADPSQVLDLLCRGGEGLHYTVAGSGCCRWTSLAEIFGGGCSGRLSRRCCSSIRCSGSGWV